jgi:NAD(P)-dependent dehydrogenase (short-subunit alcohol dehydrogenase family)
MGTYLPTKHAIPAMIKSGGGSIVSTGSDSAYQGNALLAVYGATKAAVVSFSRTVAMEFANKGIRSNTVSPGIGRTPMHAQFLKEQAEAFAEVERRIPLRRAAEPEDIARAALFLASDSAKYVTGANLMVDGGWTALGYDLA